MTRRQAFAAGFAVAVLLIYAAGCDTATAADGIPTTDALATATQAWPGSRCADQIRIVWDATLPDRGNDGEAPGAIDGTCVILVNPATRDTARGCDIIVHEAGHLAGLVHTTDGSVMDYNGGEYPACNPVPVPVTHRQAVIVDVRSLLPAEGRGRAWRITCTRDVRRCRARAPGSFTRRYEVTGSSVGFLGWVPRNCSA